jgi:hypothetical protein
MQKSQLSKETIDRIQRECAKKIKLDSTLPVITTTQEAQKWAQSGYISGATAEAERGMKLAEGITEALSYLHNAHPAKLILDKTLSQYNNTETK